MQYVTVPVVRYHAIAIMQHSTVPLVLIPPTYKTTSAPTQWYNNTTTQCIPLCYDTFFGPGPWRCLDGNSWNHSVCAFNRRCSILRTPPQDRSCTDDDSAMLVIMQHHPVLTSQVSIPAVEHKTSTLHGGTVQSYKWYHCAISACLIALEDTFKVSPVEVFLFQRPLFMLH